MIFLITLKTEMKKIEIAIKSTLAILLLLCLLKMPYSYYELVRFLALLGFAYFAYQANQESKNTATIIYAGLALLFQPFFKIALGRELWNTVDVIVAIGLLASLVIPSKNDKITK